MKKLLIASICAHWSSDGGVVCRDTSPTIEVYVNTSSMIAIRGDGIGAQLVGLHESSVALRGLYERIAGYILLCQQIIWTLRQLHVVGSASNGARSEHHLPIHCMELS